MAPSPLFRCRYDEFEAEVSIISLIVPHARALHGLLERRIRVIHRSVRSGHRNDAPNPIRGNRPAQSFYPNTKSAYSSLILDVILALELLPCLR